MRVRMTVNGVPEDEVWATALLDGGSDTVSIQCDALLTPTETYTYTLQAAVSGAGNVTVQAGSFHLAAIPTPQLPIP